MTLNLNTNYIKLVAIITMLIDHIGYIFFPNIIIFRIIGRIAFPLFVYCVALGADYTKNINNYILKLLIFGIVTQPIYILLFYGNFNYFFSNPNVLFTLCLSVISIKFIKQEKYFLSIIPLILSLLLNTEYGVYGTLLSICFFIFKNNTKKMFIVSFLFLIIQLFPYGNIQGLAVLSLFFIFIPTKINIKINKYIFYLFYPVHLLILYGLTFII